MSNCRVFRVLLLVLVLVLLVVGGGSKERLASKKVSASKRARKSDPQISSSANGERACASAEQSSNLLVSAIDGRLYALDRNDGSLRWSADTGGPLVAAFQNDSAFAGSIIVPSLAGDLFVYRSGASEAMDSQVAGLHKLPVAAPELVGLAPFIAEDGVMYLGEKTSEYFLLDPGTGTMERAYTSPSVDPQFRKDASADITAGRKTGDENCGMDKGGRELGGGPKILLGRQDYRVCAVDSASGSLSWNVTIGFVNVAGVGSAGSWSSGTEAHTSKMAGHSQPPAANDVRVIATRGGALHCVDMHSGEWLWTSHLPSPAARAFATQRVSGGSPQHMLQAVELEVVASASAQDNHFVDDNSLPLRPYDFQFVAVSGQQLYATGAVVAASSSTPLLPAAPYTQKPGGPGGADDTAHSVWRKGEIVGSDTGGLALWRDDSAECVPGRTAFPDCLTGIHPLVQPSLLDTQDPAGPGKLAADWKEVEGEAPGSRGKEVNSAVVSAASASRDGEVWRVESVAGIVPRGAHAGAGWVGPRPGGAVGAKSSPPIVVPPGGAHASPLTVHLTTDARASPHELVALYYTLDGSQPTCGNTPHQVGFSGARARGDGSIGVLMGGKGIIRLENSSTLRVICCEVGRLASHVVSHNFALRADAPTISPSYGDFAGDAQVSLDTRTDGARIVVSFDGSSPSCESLPLLGAGSGSSDKIIDFPLEGGGRGANLPGGGDGARIDIVVNATCFIMARACREGLAPSEVVASGQFHISPPSAASSFLKALRKLPWGKGNGGELVATVLPAAMIAAFLIGVLLCRRHSATSSGCTTDGDSGSDKLHKSAVRGVKSTRRKAGASVGDNLGQEPGRRGPEGPEGVERQDLDRSKAVARDKVGDRDGAVRGQGGGGGGGVRTPLRGSLSVDVAAQQMARESEAASGDGRDGRLDLAGGVSPASVPLALGSGIIKIGPMEVDTGAILGHGSQGTVVYSGWLHRRAVAVKRVLLEYVQVAEKEMDLLITSDRHPAIVRYFDRARDGAFVYLALELCICTLSDVVEHLACEKRGAEGGARGRGRERGRSAAAGVELKVPEVLAEVVAGVGFLHSLDIAQGSPGRPHAGHYA